MRLGIDAREIQDGVFTGIGRSLANLVNHIRTTSVTDYCVLFTSKPLDMDLPKHMDNHVLSEGTTFVWDQVKLPLAIRNQRLELFYSPYFKIPLNADCRKISSVLDIMYLRYKPYADEMGLGPKLYYKYFARRYLERASRVLTCSRFSRDDIADYYQIDKKKIDVVPLSVGASFYPETDRRQIESVAASFGIWGRYVLYVGNLKRHKNVERLIEAYQKVARKQDVKLVIVAPKTHEYGTLLARLSHLGIGGRVIFTGAVTDEVKLRALYSGAELFVMPSLYEGFGLPPVEAMACGTPVVSSNAASLPEVIENAGILVNPLDTDEMARTMLSVLTNEELREELKIEGFRRAELFREDKASRKLFDLMRNITQ